MESPPDNDVCSVCHDNFSLPCQANCSHWFCGQCILRVWHHGSALQACKCPICRRFITLLIPAASTQRQRSEPEASQVLENIEKYNRLFGGGSNSLVQRLRDLPFFIRRLLRELMNPQRSLPLVFRTRMIFAVCRTCRKCIHFCGISSVFPPQPPTFWEILGMNRHMVLSGLYVLSPVDILPEGVLGLVGLIDDFLILLIVFLHLAAIYRSLLLYRHGGY